LPKHCLLAGPRWYAPDNTNSETPRSGSLRRESLCVDRSTVECIFVAQVFFSDCQVTSCPTTHRGVPALDSVFPFVSKFAVHFIWHVPLCIMPTIAYRFPFECCNFPCWLFWQHPGMHFRLYNYSCCYCCCSGGFFQRGHVQGLAGWVLTCLR